MNRLLTIIFLAFTVVDYSCGQSPSSNFYVPPKAINWVSDFDNVFAPDQIDSLNSMIRKFESETTIEIAVVTIKNDWVAREKFDSLILVIHNTWGVGKKETKNGIVIGIGKAQRKIRISNGYGIEQRLSNDDTKLILDQKILPYFKADNYFEGVRQGLIAIMEKLR